MSMATGQLTLSLTVVKCENGEAEEKDVARERERRRDREEKEREPGGSAGR